jgi:hypothetical protein
MNPNQFSLPELVAVVFVIGFAIQQALQILDPFVMGGISAYKNRRPNKDLPGGMSDADFKKAVMAALSFTLGAIVTYLSGVRLIYFVRPEWSGAADFVVTAAVMGTGTEAVNTILKFMGYVKDAQKPELELSIVPSVVTVAKGQTFQFRADVKHSVNRLVEWKVLHGNGGTIDSASGLYTAPNTAGTFQVMAVSKADLAKQATATVTVT